MNRAGQTKVALIGAGGWGRQHARILARRQDVAFCAVVGRTQERTRARAEEFGVSPYLDIQVMLDKERPDLVSLCLPNLGHFGPTLQVIEAGYPLLVEKPLVFDLGEAEKLLDEASRSGLFFAIDFNHPHANLIETQCHGFDMLEHLCGRIGSIMAEMTDKTGRGYSTLSLALRFADGAVGSLLGSYDSSYAYGGTHSLEINGTGGRVLVEDTVARYTFQATGDETARVWRAGYFNDLDREFHRTFDRHVDALLDAFRRGEEPPVHARKGRRALELAYAAIESFETGERVTTA